MNPMSRVEEHLAHFRETYPDVEYVGIFLYGSQNYGLDTPESDVDTKLIVVPSLDDLVFSRAPISKTLSLPNGELIDVKDIRLMFDNYRKQNINFLETLFTPYRILNPEYSWAFNPVLKHREAIARMYEKRGAQALLGMALNKQKMLCKPSPATEAAIGKFSYDPKQLVHIDRLHEFMERFYINRESMESALICKNREFLIEEKQGYFSKDYAVGFVNDAVENIRCMVDSFDPPTTDHTEVGGNILNAAQYDIIRHSMRGGLE